MHGTHGPKSSFGAAPAQVRTDVRPAAGTDLVLCQTQARHYVTRIREALDLPAGADVFDCVRKAGNIRKRREFRVQLDSGNAERYCTIEPDDDGNLRLLPCSER